MKKHLILISLMLTCTWSANAQINTAYARALHKKYRPQPTNFCAACKLWVNPYYRSVADTVQHRPLITYYVYTKANRLEQERLKLKREGTLEAWFPAYGQPNENDVYKQANKIVQQSDKPGEIQKGHCQAWILLAYSVDGAILSDTYTFNSAMEYRGQNLGTEIASEERCRSSPVMKTTPRSPIKYRSGAAPTAASGPSAMAASRTPYRPTITRS